MAERIKLPEWGNYDKGDPDDGIKIREIIGAIIIYACNWSKELNHSRKIKELWKILRKCFANL